MENPQSIESAKPFGRWARKYLAAGFNPLPLPPGQKNPPPTGFTGHNAHVVDENQLNTWGDSKDKGNIGIRPEKVLKEFDDKEYEIVVIDVDHHPDDVKDVKDGGTSLKILEEKLGKLPDTWISSARTNGISGQRWYLAPAGLSWKGKAAKNIDILCRYYRFGAVFPSYNPDAMAQYWWYPPGFAPDGNLDAIDRKVHGLIPIANKLAILPDKWVHELTNDLTPYVPVPQDMESDPDELIRWAKKYFAPNDVMCKEMKSVSERWISRIEDCDDKHGLLTDAQWHMLKMGAEEGHKGWGIAVREFEKAWKENVLVTRPKSRAMRLNGEINRGKIQALRKIKGEMDKLIEAGSNPFGTWDICDIISKPNPASVFGDGFPQFPLPNDAGGYELNDDGNALHFLDIHNGLVRYIPNVIERWIIWDGMRWVIDEKKDIVYNLYGRVKNNQIEYAKKKMEEWERMANQPGAGKVRRVAQLWERHSNNSGMLGPKQKAIETAKHIREGISTKFEELDKDRRAIGCGNKVIRFKTLAELTGSGTGSDGGSGGSVDWRDLIEVIENDQSLLITQNTWTDYVPLEVLKTEDKVGYKLFHDFLDKFIAPSINVDYFQKLCGSVLLGDSTEKLAFFFHGKSDSGKSTMLSLMINALGDYACSRNPDIFRSTHLNPALASALSMRLMGIAEFGTNDINNELFKTLTGGDKVTCELKGKNNLVSDTPQFSIFVTTNGVPNVAGHDKAFVNRLCVIEFKHEADENEKVAGKKAQQLLYKHGSKTVLSWMIEGCARSIVEGIRPFPVEIAMATEDFAAKLSEIGVFVTDCIVESPGNFVRNDDLFHALRTWANTNNFDMKGWTPTRLTQRMNDLGFKQATKNLVIEGRSKRISKRVWLNISLVGAQYDSKV